MGLLRTAPLALLLAAVPAVVSSQARPPVESTRPESDETLEAAVARALADDRRVNAMRVKVAVRQGRVTLTGAAPDAAQRQAAEDVVRRVPGVRRVDNEIALVQPGAPPPGTSMIPDVPAE